MKIRKAEPGDFEALVKMCTSSLKATYGSFISDEKLGPWIHEGRTERYIGARLDYTLVAENGNSAVCGMVVLKDSMVDLLWIALDCRGQGFGRALMDEADGQFRSQGVRYPLLECFEPNSGAIAFYQKLGWEIEDVLFDDAAQVNKVLMCKDLGG